MNCASRTAAYNNDVEGLFGHVMVPLRSSAPFIAKLIKSLAALAKRTECCRTFPVDRAAERSSTSPVDNRSWQSRCLGGQHFEFGHLRSPSMEAGVFYVRIIQ